MPDDEFDPIEGHAIQVAADIAKQSSYDPAEMAAAFTTIYAAIIEAVKKARKG